MSNFDFDHTQCSFNVWFSMIYFVANISRKKIAVAYAMNKFSSCRTANNSIWLYMEIWAYHFNRIKSAMRFYAVMRKILMCVVYFFVRERWVNKCLAIKYQRYCDKWNVESIYKTHMEIFWMENMSKQQTVCLFNLCLWNSFILYCSKWDLLTIKKTVL